MEISCISNLNFESDNILGDHFPLELFNELDNVDEKIEYCLARNLKFVQSVDQFLEFRPCGIKMKSLRIYMSLETTYTSFLDKWIACAFSCKIEELHLILCEWDYGTIDEEKECYSFPFHMLTGGEASLKSLRLEYLIVRYPPDFHGFKSLTTLSLTDVKVSDEDMGEILSTSSILERLSLVGCSLVSLEIPCSCSRLEYLEIRNCNELENVSINAPNITTFVYTGELRNFSFGESVQLKHIEYNYLKDMCDGIKYIFGRLPHILAHLESLKILFHSYVDYDETVSIPEYFPQFKKLKRLEVIHVTKSYNNLLWMIPLLRACPVLHELQFEILSSRDLDNSRYRGELAKVDKLFRRCPLDFLKKVKISGFNGFWHEIAFASLVLKNAVNLETMTIDCHHTLYGFDWKIEAYEYGQGIEICRRRIQKFLFNRVPLGVKFVVL